MVWGLEPYRGSDAGEELSEAGTSYPTIDELFQAILTRQQVYGIADALHHLSEEAVVHKARRSVSIHAYKWRGAHSRMRLLSTEEKMHGVVCASANHAKGLPWLHRR